MRGRDPAGRVGSPQRDTAVPATIGVDIGGTSIRAAVVGSDHTVLAARETPTPHTPAETDDALVALVAELSERYPVAGVGLAVAGFVSSDRTRVMFAPHLAWRDDPVPSRLTARMGLPVVMDHDVNAAVWAEVESGVAVGSAVSLLVALGTGIGAGLVVDGQLYRGAHGVAPELGHVVLVPGGRECPCGKRGCWERYCSGTALAVTAAELLTAGSIGAGPLWTMCGGDPAALTGRMVAAAADAGDPVAAAALTELGRWLAVGLAMAADILDPELIIIGGGVAAAAPHFLPVALEQLESAITGAGSRPAPRIALASYGSNAGIIGAAMLAAAAAG